MNVANEVVDIVREQRFDNIVDLADYLQRHEKELKISFADMNNTVAANVEYFSLWFEANKKFNK